MNRAETVQQTLQRYADLVLHMNNDGIADLFAEQGELVNPGEPLIRGRELIRKFLKSFTEYKVLEENFQAASTEVSGSTATQVVRYNQKVVISSGKTLVVSGRFKIKWIAEEGKWLILKEENLPDR
ncbi:MAG: YybH family protein [Candidatus Kryptoniota bacterium]